MKYQTFTGPIPYDSSSEESESLPTGLFERRTVPGFSTWSAAVFLTSVMAGMGVLALPHAMGKTGWWGLAMVILAWVDSYYCAVLLGRSWLIMEDRWEEYRDKFRYPYPAIGLRAVGPWMRYVVAVTLHITLLGIAIVYLLLSAEIAQSIASNFVHLAYIYWIIILAAILCPLTWFGRIEDFRFAAIGALATAALACFALFISIMTSGSQPSSKVLKQFVPDFNSVSLAFGTFLFAFGGVYFSPSIQNDMSHRELYPKASLLGFIALLLLYLPVAIGGYAILGSSAPPNLLMAIQPGYLKTFIEVSLAVHLFLAFLLVINPLAQEIEEALSVQLSFNWKRCCLRTFIMLIVLLIACIVPHFYSIMNLIGGSTMSLLTFIFPPIFYILLSNDGKVLSLEDRRMSILQKLFCTQIIVVGIAGGICCTYFASIDIFDVISGKKPDYVII